MPRRSQIAASIKSRDAQDPVPILVTGPVLMVSFATICGMGVPWSFRARANRSHLPAGLARREPVPPGELSRIQGSGTTRKLFGKCGIVVMR